MSLLDKLKGRSRGQGGRRPGSMSPRDVPTTTHAASTLGTMSGDAGATTVLDSRRSLVEDEGVSIISEVEPSQLSGLGSNDPLAPPPRPPLKGLPLIGGWPIERQQRTLMALSGLGLLGLIVAGALVLRSEPGGGALAQPASQAQVHAQRLAKAATLALAGQAAAFAEVRESSQALSLQLQALREGGADEGALQPVVPLFERAARSVTQLLGQEKALVEAAASLKTVGRGAGELLATVEAAGSARGQGQVSVPEAQALGQMGLLTQRMARVAAEMQGPEGVSADAALQLGRDLGAFRETLDALLEGSAEQRLPGARDATFRDRLMALRQQFDPLAARATQVLNGLQGLVAAREAQAALVADSEPLRRGLDGLRAGGGGAAGLPTLPLAGALISLLVLATGALGLLRLFVLDQTARSRSSEMQRQEAERQEREAKRVNDANQAAILRLMNELQGVAEGDLTQQATVTEDITGAIADSVNYTVDELRSLVGQVQSAVEKVTQTTQQVEQTSTELLQASTEQLREIHETGQSVLQMAGRINDVSGSAQHSAQVARQSLQTAETGRHAVQDAINGMNTLRDQIQDTSKRIKRLGESSQEIGEITELISDITEQTNVLALNAAIQAASAGEAGRGFSVVAEEVQRLAERSADATRQIAALVRAIQGDTQDAVAAMERSTQGVVAGARLSDAAGAALADIDRVTHELSALIEDISAQALREARSASGVAENMKHIFAVTEQAGQGTRSTAQRVRELSLVAEELRASVARFKVS